jgi:dethiobiotin synthetase
MQGVFITGTGTDIGKTHVGAGIARALKLRGVNVIPRKPIESGCTLEDNELVPQDAVRLKDAARYEGKLSAVCPYRFEPPISPVRAAHLANKVLTTEQLVSICLQDSEQGFTLIEGAGGFYSPLAENGLNADLAVALQLPVILVADDRLGVLSQVLLNVEAMTLRGLNLVAVILNNLDNYNDELMNNAADLREMIKSPIFTIPYCRDPYPDLPDALIDLLTTPASGARVRAIG